MGFLKMGKDLTNFAEVQGKLATAREENRELDAALTAANLRVGELEAGRVEFENVVMAGVATLTRGEGDKLRKAEARVKELEHSLSDAMDLIEGIQGANAVHMARVAALETSIDWRTEAREVCFSDYGRDSQEQVIFSLPPRRCKLVVNWKSDCTTQGQVCWRIEDVAGRHFGYEINSVPNPELSGISTFEHVFKDDVTGVNVELTRRGDSASDTMIGDAVVVAFSVVEL